LNAEQLEDIDMGGVGDAFLRDSDGDNVPPPSSDLDDIDLDALGDMDVEDIPSNSLSWNSFMIRQSSSN